MRPDRESRPTGESRAAKSINGDSLSLTDSVDNFSRRLIIDALTQATAAHWRHRADQLDAARPQPGDYRGHATQAQRAALDERLARKAANCRNHATIMEYVDAADLLDAVLNERGPLA